MTIFNVISLFGGLALFLYGMRIMGDGLKKGSSTALKSAMEKVTNSPLIGFLLGVAVTAVIQSSTATIVLVSGLVGAGILTLRQSIGLVLGANVGTTVTAQIIRLLDVNASGSSLLNFCKPSTLAPVAAIIGILLIMAVKGRKSEIGGGIAMGFGILFTGLMNMTAAVSPLSQSEAFANVFASFGRTPILGFLAGTGVAFTIQSSSATIGILQAMATTGALTFGSIYAIIIGVNIGDCVTTAIVCSIGSKADAKRTGIIHILFNIFASALIITVLTVGHRLGAFDALWDKRMASGDIANVHTIFRLSTAVLLLPLTGVFEKLSYVIVKDDKEVGTNVDKELEMLNDKLFASPSLALHSIHEAVGAMGSLSKAGVSNALGALFSYDQEVVDVVNENESHIDQLADAVDQYILRFSTFLGKGVENDELNYYIQCFPEFERIGDLAVNITENATELYENKRSLSMMAKKELEIIDEALQEIMDYAYKAYLDSDIDCARRVEPVEEVIDDLVVELRNNHIKRLREGQCSIYTGVTFLDMLVNVERIADQCSNIGLYVVAQQPATRGINAHEYTRFLHQGNDQFFNEMFKERRSYYFEKLADADKESDVEE